MSEGWIKLHRELLNHWIWQDEKYFRWWVTILLYVNHSDTKFPVGSELLTCKPGESFKSIESWMSLFRCSKPTVLKFFELLENDGMITRKTVGKGNRRKHLLTVVNWTKFQKMETENFTRTKPKTLPEENPNVPPNNNEENDKNDKISISVIFEEFRKKYPGTKRGHKSELKNFLKKNKPEIVNLLMPALQKEIQHRESLSRNKSFVPEWKNLMTWINQECWTQEFPEINGKPTNGQPKITELLIRANVEA